MQSSIDKKIEQKNYLTDIKAQKGFAWAGFYIVQEI